MKVITLEKTKALLGITDNSQDAAITANIPIIDAKVKDISGNRFNWQIAGNMTLDSNLIEVSSIINNGINYVIRDRNYRTGYNNSGINNPYVIDDITEYLQIGQLVEGTSIPAEAYIEEVYESGCTLEGSYFDVPVIRISANATATGTECIYLGINIGLQPTIAKGIQYLINSTNTSIPTNSLASRTIGPSSKSFGTQDQAIDNKWGMPAWFVKAFPKYQGGH